MDACFNEPAGLLNELINDFSVSKNIRNRLEDVMSILDGEGEVAVKCDKAIQVLTLIDDSNLNMFIKTRIWSLLSMLESVANE